MKKNSRSFILILALPRELWGLECQYNGDSIPYPYQIKAPLLNNLLPKKFLRIPIFIKNQDSIIGIVKQETAEQRLILLFKVNGNIIPVSKIKSSTQGRMKSLHLFLESHPLSHFGVKLSTGPFAQHTNLLDIPLYAIESWLHGTYGLDLRIWNPYATYALFPFRCQPFSLISRFYQPPVWHHHYS